MYVELSKLRSLFGLQFLVPIIFYCFVNSSKDKLIEEKIYFEKLSYIIFHYFITNVIYYSVINYV